MQAEGVQEQGADKDFGSQMEEVTWCWRKVYNKELHNLYTSLNVIGVIQ